MSLRRPALYKPAFSPASCEKSPVPRSLLLLFAAWPLLVAGCDIRDEEARAGSDSTWLEAVAHRIATDAAADTAAGPGSGVPAECVEEFAPAARRAALERLPLLLVFRAGWCRWSGSLLETIRDDPRLPAASGRFVCATVDADRDAAACRSFGVTIFPTVIVLDETGRERFRATGRRARDNLPAAFAAALGPAIRVGSLPPTDPRRSLQ